MKLLEDKIAGRGRTGLKLEGLRVDRLIFDIEQALQRLGYVDRLPSAIHLMLDEGIMAKISFSIGADGDIVARPHTKQGKDLLENHYAKR